jgi:hypothetical protein
LAVSSIGGFAPRTIYWMGGSELFGMKFKERNAAFYKKYKELNGCTEKQ